MVDWLEVGKWVLIVFLAGFIGYFGKRLSQYLIEKFNRKKKMEKSHQIVEHRNMGKYDYKLEKKGSRL